MTIGSLLFVCPTERMGAPVGNLYAAATIAGGFHVPSPAGKIDGGVSLGQYSRITR
jgi:hypothetical protein